MCYENFSVIQSIIDNKPDDQAAFLFLLGVLCRYQNWIMGLHTCCVVVSEVMSMSTKITTIITSRCQLLTGNFQSLSPMILSLRHCISVDREKNKVVCVAPPLVNAAMVGVPQSVSIVWRDPGVPNQYTGYSFTYKPNPTVHGVDNNFTFPWYGTLS